MLNWESLFLFLFVFTTLVLLKSSSKLIGALLGKNIIFTHREILFIGLSLSYWITYILQV
jgi:hypothetical protein